MTRCVEFYQKWQKTPNWCEKTKGAVSQINSYLAFVKDLKTEYDIDEEFSFLNLPEGAASYIHSIKDGRHRARTISKVVENLREGKTLSTPDVRDIIDYTTHALNDERVTLERQEDKSDSKGTDKRVYAADDDEGNYRAYIKVRGRVCALSWKDADTLEAAREIKVSDDTWTNSYDCLINNVSTEAEAVKAIKANHKERKEREAEIKTKWEAEREAEIKTKCEALEQKMIKYEQEANEVLEPSVETLPEETTEETQEHLDELDEAALNNLTGASTRFYDMLKRINDIKNDATRAKAWHVIEEIREACDVALRGGQ